ncbi:hypothetical protein HHK36_025406 [Tetracentron sinense]|uniref:TF-B3 domain-containing protein n=1 Tax=Tetracentron sinense TaxID=13715 RepID=A0A835D3J0_TETSI|nr:hypothetical protein HHK36_025406 [Tetracentron sinense]
MCEYVILRSCCGKSWRVKINGLRFEEGWKDFARDHSLRVGDFLVFRYEKDMVFDVLVFDTSACERDYPWFHFKVDDQMEEKEGKVEMLKDFKSVTKARRAMARPKVQAKACSFSHGHPRFKITVKQYILKKGRLNIPRGFARRNGLTSKCCTMTIRDQKGRSWPVILRHKKSDGQVYIGRGWRQFSLANGLKKGDVCTFQLILGRKEKHLMVFYPGSCVRDYPHFDFKVDDQMEEKRGIVEIVKDFKSITKARCAMARPKVQAKACSLSHGHPRFVITVNSKSLKEGRMNIPMGFARINGLTNKCCTMTIRDQKGRSWPVTLRHKNSDGQVYIGCGWRQFSVANGLKKGDVCTFELILRGKDVMMLHWL